MEEKNPHELLHGQKLKSESSQVEEIIFREKMLNIEVLGENGAWYKVNIHLIARRRHFPHEFHLL